MDGILSGYGNRFTPRANAVIHQTQATAYYAIDLPLEFLVYVSHSPGDASRVTLARDARFMTITPIFAVAGGDWWMAIPLVIGIFIIVVFVFQLLWNTTMPQVFQLRQITFWQALRLLLLASIIFGGSWIKRGQ